MIEEQDPFDPTSFEQEQEAESEDSDDVGEGSSTAVRIRKVGTKRGKKLQRKEQMRQYREVKKTHGLYIIDQIF